MTHRGRWAVTICFGLVGYGAIIWCVCWSNYVNRPMPGLVDGNYRCIRVIDGDTIVLNNVGSCRFATINAPELDEPGGPEAKQALVDRIEGELVWIEFKRNKASQPVRGHWGRPLIFAEGTGAQGQGR